MSIDQHQTVKLIVNRAIVILQDGTLIETEKYTSTDKGVYIVVENYAKTFGLEWSLNEQLKKLAFIPYTNVKTVLYDVTEGDTDSKQEGTSSAQTSNIG